MMIVNTLDTFLEKRGVKTAYRFQKDTGLAEATARRLFKRRDVFPDKSSIAKICEAYRVKPGEFLDYVFDFEEAS